MGIESKEDETRTSNEQDTRVEKYKHGVNMSFLFNLNHL